MATKRKFKVFYDIHSGGHGSSTATVEAESESDAAAVFKRLHDSRAIIARVVPA